MPKGGTGKAPQATTESPGKRRSEGGPASRPRDAYSGMMRLQQTVGNREAARLLRGLPDPLRTGVERLSGLSLDDVVVHYRSSRPAKHGARAITDGAQIHVAPGAEQHLPHEAWHVVQQKRGQIRETRRARGERLNDDARFEREAGVMGERALRLGDPRGGDFVPAPRAVAEPVVQCLVTQIVPGAHGTVQDVIVIGRPPNTFGASMGDHTTAFVVQLYSVKRRLIGRTFGEALAALDGLVKELADLPGFTMLDALPARQLRMFFAAYRHLLELRGQAAAFIAPPSKAPSPSSPSSPPPSKAVVVSSSGSTAEALLLQDYVNAYLEVRELVPLSAINVRAVAPALAGKGKGESNNADLLWRYETKAAVFDGAAALAAIGRLFDAKAVALAGVQTDPGTLMEMAPGLPSKLTAGDRLDAIARQHAIAIEQAFPNVTAALHGRGDVRDHIMVHARGQVAVELVKEKTRCEQQKAVAERERGMQRVLLVTTKRDRNARDAAVGRYDDIIAAQDARIRAIDTELGSAASSAAVKERAALELAEEAAFEKAKKKKKDKSDVDDPRKQPLGIQIHLEPKSGVILSIESDGRSPSPFSGSMGAHTTAWVVHVDRMRAALVGRTPAAAIGVIAGPLLAETLTVLKERGPKFSKAHAHAALTPALAKLDVLIKAALAAGGSMQLLLLQQCIGQLLAVINYLPGSTMESADTGGKGEAKWRAILLDPGGASRKDVIEAIAGLLDLRNTADWDENEILAKHHLEAVRAAYPAIRGFKIKSTEISAAAAAASERSKDSDDEDGGKKGKSKKPAAKKRKVGDDELGLGPLYADYGTLVAADGTIAGAARATFLDAYRADVRTERTWLTEGEGHVVARALGFRLQIFRGAVAPGGWTMTDVPGDGNCLIHSLVAIDNARNGRRADIADDEMVRLTRDAIASNMDAEDILALCSVAVNRAMAGLPEAGLGSRVNTLLDDPSIHRARYAQALDFVSSKKPSPSPSPPKPAPKVAGPVAPAALIYIGQGQAVADYALLHKGGNHYVWMRRT